VVQTASGKKGVAAMSLTIADKTVLVTGGNRGLGRALVDEALRRGVKRVYAASRQPMVIPDERVVPVMLDVTNESQIQRAVGQVDSLDILINNAGVSVPDDLSDRSAFERHLAVNLYGTLDVTQAFVPSLTHSRGAVVNIVSLGSVAAVPVLPAYSVSKAASLSLTQSLRALASRGVSVYAVMPGPIDTDMVRDLDIPKTPPEDVADRERSSTRWEPVRTTSSRIRCQRRWRRAGAPERSRSSSARTRRWWQPSRSRREQGDRTMETTTTHKIAPREEWLAARAALLEREKEHTRLGDELAQQRRELPWVPVEKQYTLQTAGGPKTLAELFDGRSRLLIYHFMFGPSYETGCPVNSSIADSFDGVIPHLKARDVTLIAVSGAPIETLLAYRERMGWSFNWASSYESDFNADLGFSSSPERTREAIESMLDQLPAVAFRNAKVAGTDIYGYLTELFGFTVFTLEDGTVSQT
jgi:predicted dithiol-disulfide oxidoreductase (DUF899 family)/short-subunit dehydrogenase